MIGLGPGEEKRQNPAFNCSQITELTPRKTSGNFLHEHAD